MDAISLRDVSFRYAGAKEDALSGASLSIKSGQFVGIIGPVGSGKTTLLYSMNGLVPKETGGRFGGRAEIFGKDLKQSSFREIAGQCAMVFQDPDDQIFNMTVLDEVKFGLCCTESKASKERALRAISSVGLGGKEGRDPSELSAGQRQKVAIACALARDSKILLLDEPVSSLDWKSSNEIYGMLSELSREGKTIVITEQDTGLLLKHADRIVLLSEGRVEMDGGTEVLFSRKMEKLGLRLPPIAEVARELGIRGGQKEILRRLSARR